MYTTCLFTPHARDKSWLCDGQALAGLRVILSVRPSALATMLPRLLKPPLSTADVTALGSLSEVAGANKNCPDLYTNTAAAHVHTLHLALCLLH